MKLAINLTLFLFTVLLIPERSDSISDYKIKKICKRERMVSKCIRDLNEKRSILQKGKLIEIPVIPYKR